MKADSSVTQPSLAMAGAVLIFSIALGSVVLGEKQGLLTDAEMVETQALQCPGNCDEATATDCKQADECTNSCQWGWGIEQLGLVCNPTQGKDYANVTYQVCAPNPTTPNRFCNEGDDNFECYDVRLCTPGNIVMDAICVAGDPGLTLKKCKVDPQQYTSECRVCTNGADTTGEGTRDEDACVDCPSE